MTVEKEMTPTEYFELIKAKQNEVDDHELNRIYENCLELLNKYKITGQNQAAEKLIFHLNTIEKEREVIKSGINTFVYREDIEEFIESVASNTVKIIELEQYEREIPDEVVASLSKVKDLFDQFYVVFTDYTGKAEKKVEKARRDKDPILFGTFQDEESMTVIDRFYYIGDWEDEFCDLTLDKMVNEVREHSDKEIEFTIKTPEDIKEFEEQLRKINSVDGRLRMVNQKIKKPSFFSRVRTFLTNKGN